MNSVMVTNWASLQSTIEGKVALPGSPDYEHANKPFNARFHEVRPDATAFVHRSELFQLKHQVIVDPQGVPGEKADAHRWVDRSWGSVHPWGSGRVFQNFADPDLKGWAEACYGTNYRRLVVVKARYDPQNFFRFH